MPDTFDAHDCLYRLFDARKARVKAVRELAVTQAEVDRKLTAAKAEIDRLDVEIADATQMLCLSFDISPVKAVTFQHDYKNHAVVMIDGNMHILPSGTAFSLEAPDVTSLEAELSSHATLQTFGDDSGDADSLRLYDALQRTSA